MSAPKKVLMLTTQLGYGGAETSFIRLANFLAQSMDVTVALFTSDYGQGAYAKGHEPLQAKIVLLDAGTNTGQVGRWWRRIAAMHKLKRQHDVTISFLSGPNMVNVLAGCNARTVISLRGSQHYDPGLPLWVRRLFRHMIDPVLFYFAARIIPVSEGFRHEVRCASGKKSLHKVKVISPFIDYEMLQARRAEMPPASYAPLKGQKVIVAVGRLSMVKGFQHLIRIFVALQKKEPAAKLLLIGDGPMLSDLRMQCDSSGITMDDVTAGVASVIFAGYQKNPLPLMALGRVYTITSVTEGFPNVVLEAMAVGLPVVAADTPWGVRSILAPALADSPKPYPTQHATKTDYGTLMPRIDMPEYESIWAQTLADHLREPRAVNSAAIKRLADYDIAIIGKKWHQLIMDMGAA